MAKRIAVVIPAYQAAATLRSVFDRIPKAFMEKAPLFLIVNDGSTDETQRVAEDIARALPHTEVLTHPHNRGYAQAQKTGFTEALRRGADIVVLLHSDGQYAPELLPELVAPLERDEADVVQGSRMLNPAGALRGGMPLYKWLANRALSAVENLAYGMKLAEYHSGYMLYSRRALEAIPFLKLSDTFHFDGEMLLMAGKRRLRIREIPIPTHYGSEKSHLRPIAYGFDVLKIILRNALGKYDL